MISIGFENHDSSFFNIRSKDAPQAKGYYINEDIISFSYTEELGRYGTGTLKLYDPDHYYSKTLGLGRPLEISFGYASRTMEKNLLLLNSLNPSQVSGSLVRENIQGRISNPSGGGSQQGVVTYDCNFYGIEFLGKKLHRIHTGLSKGSLVAQLLIELGCDEIEVNFTRQKELLNDNTQILQRETNYKLLLRFAYEWRAIFRIGQNQKGKLTAVFLSPQNLSNSSVARLFSGATAGDSIFLEYKQGIANVLSYTWKNHQGESGSGDNVRIITGADGKPSVIRYVATTDKIKAYKLNPDRIKNRLREAGDFSKRSEKLKEWLSTPDFETIKWAFDPIELTTAPQGLGYSMSLKMLGNPLLTAPLKIFYGEGFPIYFTPKDPKKHVVNFYANKVTHNIDKSGYTNEIEIADAFTITGGSLI